VIILATSIIVLDWWGYTAHHSAFLPLTHIYDAVAHLQDRPSHRGGIWQMAIGLIMQQPWFGYGMQAKFSYGYGGVNPHNIFISAFFYTGIVGGVLLLAVVASSLRVAWQHRRTPQGALAFTLLLHAIFACMTDQGQYVHSPAPQWTIFWLPVALAIRLINPYKGALMNKNAQHNKDVV
jgi:O-antigen ligase